MSSLNDSQKAFIEHSRKYVQAASQVMGLLATNNPTGEAAAVLNGFDSLAGSTIDGKPSAVAEVLQGFDSLGENASQHILRGISYGIAGYQELHGTKPTDQMVAAGLAAGVALLTSKDQKQKLLSGFDSIDFTSAQQPSVVPEMTVVTIATAIANSIPMVAMLPNAMGSNEVPLVYARYKANMNFGGVDAGDFLDGEKSTRMYVENRPTFALTQVGVTNQYTLTVRTHYLDYTAKTPDPASPLAPFLGGRVVVKVNGNKVATDYSKNNSRQSGTHALIPESGVVVGGVPITVSTSLVDLDNHTISITFGAALPAGAVVTADVIFDFERENAQGQPIITPPGVGIDVEYAEVLASPARAQVKVTIDAMTQMQNELKISPAAASLAYLQQRFYLEQNLRLLSQAKSLATLNGRIETFDASRNVAGNMAAVYNTTGDLMAEMFKHVELGKIKITQRVGQAASAYDLFVSDLLAVRFNQLSPDRFIKSGVPYGRHDGIVRLGTLTDGTNVYYVPKSTGLLTDEAQTAQALLIARGNEPAKSPFVGHMPVPPMVRMANPSAFDERFGLFCRTAAEINPLQRFGDQNCIINCINLPSLG